MEEADIYYVDDVRNATRDHRVFGGAGRGWRARPAVVQTAQGGGYRPTQTSVPVYQEPVYPQAVIAPPGFAGPVYQQGGTWPTGGWPWYGHHSPGILGRLTLGQVAELAAQAVAALMSLPAAPAPNDGGDPNDSIANLVTYQTALAQHAKRDEQLRTLGSLVARLVA